MNITKKFNFYFFSFLFTFLVTGCNNFFNANDFLKELEDNIDYINAQSYTVLVAADEGTGTIVAGLGDNELKVTDSLLIRFSKSKTYKFIEWQAVQKNNESISMEEYVSFKDRTAIETTVTLIKEPNEPILIKPYCESSLSFTATYPEFKDEGVPRDSAIKLVFSSPLSENNDFSKIQISIEGSNVDANLHFEEPVIAENELLISPKLSNRISVIGKDYKTIIVTIPEDIKYIGKNGEEIEIGEELTHTYKINSTTSDKTFITYGAEDENAGIFKVNGIAATSVGQQYSIGESIDVTFKVNEGYVFESWNCSNEEAIFLQKPDTKENPEYDKNGFNSETQTAFATLKIINEAKNVTFRAKTHKIPDADINGTNNEFGTYSYDINKKYLEGNGGTLGFTPTADYQFIRWMIWDAKANGGAGAEITNGTYISIKEPKETNTTFTLTKVPENIANMQLWIKPVCAERPKVVSATPNYDASGVFRDRKIAIMFDKLMDESSIYWTAAELDSMNVSIANKTEAPGKTDADGNAYYYKYTDANGNIFYKNITITKLEDESENYLKYYGEPAFDSENPRFLRIPVQKDNELPPTVNVLVTLSGNFNFYDDTLKENISLGSKYKFSYRTNGSIDNVDPEITDVVFKFGDKAGTKEDDFKTDFATSFTKTNLKAQNLKEKKIWVSGKISDGASGPKMVDWKMEKIDNTEFYPISIVKNYSHSGQIEKLNFNGQEATFSESIDMDSLNLTEGIYRLTLYGYDVNENSAPAEKTCDFVYDATAPADSSISHFSSQAKDAVTVKLKSSSSPDYWKTKIQDTDLTENGATTAFTNLGTDSRAHTFSITTYDYAGNSSTCTNTVSAEPTIGMIYYSDGYWSKDYVESKTPIGVICDVTDYGKTTDYSKVRIWDLTKKQNLIWGTMDTPPYSDHSDTTNDPHFYTKDGLATYNKYYSSFPSGTFNDSRSYWYWLKNTKNKNSPVTWYIPTYQEIQEFYVRNYSDLKTTFETLKANNIQVDPQTSTLTTCIPGKYDKSTAKGYTRAYIIYSSPAAITSDVTFRDGQSSNCQCMAQVNLN